MKRGARALWLAALLVLCCAALLPLLPLLGSLLPVFEPLERAASYWFALHCHRDPARTLHWLGVPLAVCARCCGIYFGFGLGAALRKPRLTPPQLRAWLGGACALMLTDVALESYGWHGAWAWLRLATGALLGYPVGVALGTQASERLATQSP